MANLPKTGDCYCCEDCGMGLIVTADCACDEPDGACFRCCGKEMTLDAPMAGRGISKSKTDTYVRALTKKYPAANPEHVKATLVGLPILTVLWLLVQFGATFGPQLFTIISDVLATISKPGGFTLADLTALASKYGAQVQSLVQALLAIFGVPLPLPAPVS